VTESGTTALAVVLLGCAPPEKGPGVTIARGNEPFWAVSLDGPVARIRTPDLPDGIAWHDGRWKRDSTGAGWIFKARRDGAEGLWLTLEITEARCTDTMSGAESPFRAVLTYDDKRVEGCASS
jgi:uncharacterized membrane protein